MLRACRRMSGTTYLMMAALGGRTGGAYYKLRGPVTAPWGGAGWCAVWQVTCACAGRGKLLVRMEGEADAYVRAQ